MKTTFVGKKVKFRSADEAEYCFELCLKIAEAAKVAACGVGAQPLRSLAYEADGSCRPPTKRKPPSGTHLRVLARPF